MQDTQTIAQMQDDPTKLKLTQVRLPVALVRHAKSQAAARGWSLRELVKAAIEQYLGIEGKAA